MSDKVFAYTPMVHELLFVLKNTEPTNPVTHTLATASAQGEQEEKPVPDIPLAIVVEPGYIGTALNPVPQALATQVTPEGIPPVMLVKPVPHPLA
jgi:hypothetical protein